MEIERKPRPASSYPLDTDVMGRMAIASSAPFTTTPVAVKQLKDNHNTIYPDSMNSAKQPERRVAAFLLAPCSTSTHACKLDAHHRF